MNDPFITQENPLEKLRVTKDTMKRSALLRELDSTWSEWEERYTPTPAEVCLSRELGVPQSTVMLAAVQNPGLSSLDAGSQVQPAVRALLAAGVSAQDAWFVLSKKWALMEHPAVLSRWLDFLSVYGMAPRDCQNFLLRAPPQLMTGETTLFQAGAVVSFLKSLGPKDDLLASRVLCVWPELLARDVEAQLRPVVNYLMSLGLEVADVGRVVVLWPEVLLKSVEGHLQPWVGYLRGLGCTTSQVADVVCLCPHLLGFPPEEVFGGVLRSLASIGVGPEEVRAMVSSSLAFLISPSASAGVRAAVDCLLANGFSTEEVRSMVLARPELLAAKPHELERCLRFVYGTVGGDRDTVLRCPLLLARPLGQVLGPRYSFVQKHGLAHRYIAKEASAAANTTTTASSTSSQTPTSLSPATEEQTSSPSSSSSSSAAPSASSPASSTSPADSITSSSGTNTTTTTTSTASSSGSAFEFYPLLLAEDDQWCASLGLSINEYQGFKLVWDEEYSLQLHQEAANEFQAELKKLGIYEGMQ